MLNVLGQIIEYTFADIETYSGERLKFSCARFSGPSSNEGSQTSYKFNSQKGCQTVDCFYQHVCSTCFKKVGIQIIRPTNVREVECFRFFGGLYWLNEKGEKSLDKKQVSVLDV